MREKFKYLIMTDQIFYSLLVILVGLGGFLLGGGEIVKNIPDKEVVPQISVKADEVQEESVTVTTRTLNLSSSTVKVIASKNGTRYHLPTCPGAKQIKDENRIEFASVILAEAAGYKPSANCPGLVQ